MDNEILEIALKTTLFLSIGLGVSLFPRWSSAAFRVIFSLAMLLGCLAIVATVNFLPEQTAWTPVFAISEAVVPSLVSAEAVAYTPQPVGYDLWFVFWVLTALFIGVFLFRLTRARIKLGRLAKLRVCDDLVWAQNQIEVRQRILLVEHDYSASTFTFGILRPLVAVPVGFAAWPRQKRRAALLHELVHVKRKDFLLLSTASLAVAILWWHPMAWLLLKAMQRDVERACDDEVLAADVHLTPTMYAQYLFEVASQSKRKLAREPMVPMAAPGALRSRISALVDTQQRRTMMQGSKQTLVVTLGLLIAGLMGASHVVQADSGPDRRYMPVYKTLPVHPEAAEDQKLEGWVLLEFDVSSTGATTNISVVDSSHAIFDQAAVDAVANFRYLPERSDGETVAVQGIRNKVTFALANDPEKAGSDLERTLQTAANQKFAIQRQIETAALEAERAEDGDRLLELANMSLDHNLGLASHLLLRAGDIGVSDVGALQLTTGIAFYKQGDLAKAASEFAGLAAGSGPHNKVAEQWQTFVERESVRRAVVHEALSAR